MQAGILKKYAYAWITIGFFLISFGLHWLFGWYAYVDQALQNERTPEIHGYLVEMGRDTFENWQSEFLQLLWQVVGLAYFLYVGSPTSKENDDRVEAKIDRLIELQAGKQAAQEMIDDIDRHYLRHHGHAAPHGHTSEGRE